MQGYKIPGDGRFGPFGVYASPGELVSWMELAKLKMLHKGFGDTAASVPLARDSLS